MAFFDCQSGGTESHTIRVYIKTIKHPTLGGWVQGTAVMYIDGQQVQSVTWNISTSSDITKEFSYTLE